MKSWTASSTASGGTGQMTSPPTRSPSRLVARMRRPGQRRSRSSARSAAAAITCSQLSSRISSSRSPIDRRQPARVREVERGGDRGAHADRIADGRELDQARAAGQRRRSSAGDLHREAGLADASRPDEGDEAVVVEEAGELGHLRLAPDQRRQRRRDRRAAVGGRSAARSRVGTGRTVERRVLARIADSSWRSSGLGSSPSSSPSRRRPSWNTRSASACRPPRYIASISSPRSRSRSGWARHECVELADRLAVPTDLELEVESLLDRRRAAAPSAG